MSKRQSPSRKRRKTTKAQTARALREKQALESLAQKRLPFEPLLQEIVGAVLHAHSPKLASPDNAGPPPRWVEVGSGLGQLRRLLPASVRLHTTHTELSKSLVAGLLEQHPDANALPASVTELPFETGSVDGVLGLCVFDSFPEPEKACREIARVLRLGGRFVHFLDAATNIEPLLVELVEHGLLPLPNFLADTAARRPDLLEPAAVEHLIQPYHDVLSVPLVQFRAVTEMLRRSSHPLAVMLQDYVATFLKRPFDPLPAARAFVKLTSDTSVGRPVNQALTSLFTTLHHPKYAAQVPFEMRSHSSLAYFSAKLEHHFGPSFGYQLEFSKVVYTRRYEPDEDSPLRARVRRVGIGLNSPHWPAPQGMATSELQARPSAEDEQVSPTSHVLREAAIYCLAAERIR